MTSVFMLLSQTQSKLPSHRLGSIGSQLVGVERANAYARTSDWEGWIFEVDDVGCCGVAGLERGRCVRTRSCRKSDNRYSEKWCVGRPYA